MDALPSVRDDPHERAGGLGLITAYLVLLFAVPSTLVIGPLGSAGAPSTVLGIAALMWWCWCHARGKGLPWTEPQPVRMAAFVFVTAVLLAYTHAMATVLPQDEVTTADSALLRISGFIGVLLVATECIRTKEAWLRLVQRLIVAVALVALLSIVQAVTGEAWIDRVSLPGLTESAPLTSIVDRSGLTRPAATAVSPIEVGVALAMALPLALSFAIHVPSRRGLNWTATVIISLAVILVLSRSAVVGSLVGVVVLYFSWTPQLRRGALLFAVAILTAVYLTRPGVLGTLQGLFLGLGDDPSVQSRTQSYDVALDFFQRSPLVGRGLGTFLPKYWIFDNQYLVLLVELGLLGLTAFLGMLLTALLTARSAFRACPRRETREVTRGLAASVAAGACGVFFFDALSFPQAAGLLFLVVGLCGTSSNLSRDHLDH